MRSRPALTRKFFSLQSSISSIRSSVSQRANFASSCSTRLEALHPPSATAKPASASTSRSKTAISGLRPAKIPLSLKTPEGNVTASRLKHYNKAKRLFENGQTLLYKAPPTVGFTLGSYALGLACLSGTLTLLGSRLWEWNPELGLPYIVPISYRVSAAVFTLIGGWVILRSRRQIFTLQLVSRDSEVKMLVTLRRTLPFIRRKQIVTPTADFILDSKIVESAPPPSWAQEVEKASGNIMSRFLRRISISFFNFFAGTRKIFTYEGFLIATINGHGTSYKLDINGYFDEGGQSLTDVASMDYETA